MTGPRGYGTLVSSSIHHKGFIMLSLRHFVPGTTTTQHGPAYMDRMESWKVLNSTGDVVAEIVRDFFLGSMCYCVYRHGYGIFGAETLDDAFHYCGCL